MGDSIGRASAAAAADKSRLSSRTAELPGCVMQQASSYSAAKVKDMHELVQTMMGANSKGGEESQETAGAALQRWTQLRQATLRNKEFVSLLTDADDTQAQEALQAAEALGGTVEVETDSDEGATFNA